MIIFNFLPIYLVIDKVHIISAIFNVCKIGLFCGHDPAIAKNGVHWLVTSLKD